MIKKYVAPVLVLFSVLFALKAFAAEEALQEPVFENSRLVQGAGTLAKGKKAFSLNLGLDLPEPLIYGIRFDFGVAKHYQLGFSGSVLGAVNTFGMNHLVNFYQSKNSRHFLSLAFSPFVAVTSESANNFYFFLPPSLIYEIRDEKGDTGFFVKAGTNSQLLVNPSRIFSEDDGWEHAFRGSVGFQKAFKKVGFFFEAGLFKDLSANVFVPVLKTGWTWGF